MDIKCVSVLSVSAMTVMAAMLSMLESDIGAAESLPSKAVTEYKNPTTVLANDSFVLKDGDAYYMYASSSSATAIDVYSSPDLVNWRRHGNCIQATTSVWAGTSYWGPTVAKQGDTYYMYYSALSVAAQARSICVATSKSPQGPFVPVRTPMIGGPVTLSDPEIVRDPASGRCFLFVTDEQVGKSRISWCMLNPNMLDADTSPSVCLEASQSWENSWLEGPSIFSREGHWYMLYSGGRRYDFTRAVGYATAKSPLGPWEKYAQNPVLQSRGSITGPGQTWVVPTPDGQEMYVGYHRTSATSGRKRSLAIDRILFAAGHDGPDIIDLSGAPSGDAQPIPSGTPRRFVARSDEFNGTDLDFTQWLVLFENPRNWRLQNGFLTIRTEGGDLWQHFSDAKNLFVQHAPDGDYRVSTHLQMDVRKNHEQGLIFIGSDGDNYLKFAFVYVNDGRKFEIAREIGGKYECFVVPNQYETDVYMGIHRKGNHYSFFAGADGVRWTEVGKGWDFDKKNLLIGLSAWSPVSRRAIDARFDYFKIETGEFIPVGLDVDMDQP